MENYMWQRGVFIVLSQYVFGCYPFGKLSCIPACIFFLMYLNLSIVQYIATYADFWDNYSPISSLLGMRLKGRERERGENKKRKAQSERDEEVRLPGHCFFVDFKSSKSQSASI